MAKINDPVRASAYAALGIATVCRTSMMVESLGGFVGLPADCGRHARPAPVGTPSGAARATGSHAASCRARRDVVGGPALMYVIVVGGGKVGYYLTKELLAAGHELVLLEKDRDARQADRRRGRLHRARA